MVAQMTGASIGHFGLNNYGDLRGDRPPDDGRLDFVLLEDDVEDDFLPDMLGLFNVVTDLRHPGRVEITPNPTMIASAG